MIGSWSGEWQLCPVSGLLSQFIYIFFQKITTVMWMYCIGNRPSFVEASNSFIPPIKPEHRSPQEEDEKKIFIRLSHPVSQS